MPYREIRSKDQIEYRDNLIRSGKHTLSEIEELTGYCKHTISSRARLFGISLPGARVLNIKPNRQRFKYTVDHNYFKEWTEGSSYLIGLIAADGCIVKYSDTSYMLKISFRKSDIDHLYKIQHLLGSNHRLYESHHAFTLQINSYNICSDLINIGVTPNKSLKLKWIDSCPDMYVSHLVRGYLDGDGHIGIRRKNSILTHMVGTYDFVFNIGRFFGINHSIYKHTIELTRMSRKYNVYLNHINSI